MNTLGACTNDRQPSGHTRHYVIVRADLPLGLLAAQVIHAAGESGRMAPIPDGTHAIALAAEDESDLQKLAQRLTELKIPHAAIVEGDAPYIGQLMAIGLAPCCNGIAKAACRGRRALR